jgi:superfamily II DNA/RNA helicase
MAPEIKKLADKFLMNPKEITVARPATTAETVRQGLLMVNCKLHDGRTKRAALRALIDSEEVKNAIVFCNRKRDVGIVCRSLNKHGYNAGQMHGDMIQSARMETLEKFKNDEITFLVCSDVAARGLDIPALSHVFNYDLPNNADDYVHRIGRTGRAGKEGTALSLSTPDDKKHLTAIVKLINSKIPPVELEDFPPKEEKKEKKERRPKRERGRGNKYDRHVTDEVQVQEEPENGVVIGMGAHTPAFLLRPVEIEEEKPAKTKTATKKTATKKKTTTRKKKAEVEATAEEAPKPARKRGRPKKKTESEAEAVSDAEVKVEPAVEEAPKPARKRGRPKKKVEAESAEPTVEEAPKPARKRGRPKKKAEEPKEVIEIPIEE